MITITSIVVAVLIGIGISVYVFRDPIAPAWMVVGVSAVETFLWVLFAGWLGFIFSTTTVSYTKVPNTVYTYRVNYTVHAFGEDVLTSEPEYPGDVYNMQGRKALKVGKDYYVKVIGEKDK